MGNSFVLTIYFLYCTLKLTKFPNCFTYINDELLWIVIREIQIGREFVFPNYNLFFQLRHYVVFLFTLMKSLYNGCV
jgi:hypothetical protein